jgi:ABC-type Fe3+/spermidine/putrescine transport system ATPase subunit
LHVQCPGLAATIEVADDGPVPAGAHVWVAIRPEKIELHGAAQPGAVAGEIVEIGYHGDSSVYHVRAGGGAVLRVSAANAARDGGGLYGRGQKLWLRWAMANAVLLRH